MHAVQMPPADLERKIIESKIVTLRRKAIAERHVELAGRKQNPFKGASGALADAERELSEYDAASERAKIETRLREEQNAAAEYVQTVDFYERLVTQDLPAAEKALSDAEKAHEILYRECTLTPDERAKWRPTSEDGQDRFIATERGRIGWAKDQKAADRILASAAEVRRLTQVRDGVRSGVANLQQHFPEFIGAAFGGKK